MVSIAVLGLMYISYIGDYYAIYNYVGIGLMPREFYSY